MPTVWRLPDMQKQTPFPAAVFGEKDLGATLRRHVAILLDRTHHDPPFSAIFDNNAAISRPRPLAACW